MISKELLSEVLDVEVRVIAGVTSTNELKYNNDSIAQFINIYELAHKCKEWAFQQHKMQIGTTYLCDKEKVYGKIGCRLGHISNNTVNRKIELTWNDRYYCIKIFDTEQLAIFSACQWILDNKTN